MISLNIKRCWSYNHTAYRILLLLFWYLWNAIAIEQRVSMCLPRCNYWENIKFFNLDVYYSDFTEKGMKLSEIPILQYAFIFIFNFTLTVLHKHVFKENQFTFWKCFNKKLSVRKTWLLVCLYSMKVGWRHFLFDLFFTYIFILTKEIWITYWYIKSKWIETGRLISSNRNHFDCIRKYANQILDQFSS